MSYGLTDVDRVKRLLRIPAGVTQHDAVLADLALAGERAVLSELRLTGGITQSNYTDRVDANGPYVQTRRFPVQAVSSVVDTGTTLASTAYTWTAEGLITLLGGACFSTERRSVVITYAAGFTNAGLDAIPPPDLAHAATLAAACAWNRDPRAGLVDADTGDYSISVDVERAYTSEYEAILGRYRNMMG